MLRALEQLAVLDRSRGIHEPGFWPWQDVYAKALVMKDRVDEDDALARQTYAKRCERELQACVLATARPVHDGFSTLTAQDQTAACWWPLAPVTSRRPRNSLSASRPSSTT